MEHGEKQNLYTHSSCHEDAFQGGVMITPRLLLGWESWQGTEALKGSNAEEMTLGSRFPTSSQAARREVAQEELWMCEDLHL